MQKFIYIFLFLSINLLARASDYDALYDNITKDDNNITQSTIKRHLTSSYNLSAYESNYFLPISYRAEGDYADNANLGHEALQAETEFQISIKYDIASNVFGLGEVYSGAYTQKSFWQLYAGSAYFRESNYNPELFVVLPIVLDAHINGLKALQLGFAHQSNGRGGAEERSWNYIYTSIYFQIKQVFFDIRIYKDVGSLKYNKDLMDYLGYGYFRVIVPHKKHFFETKLTFCKEGYGSAQLDYTYPVPLRDDLFFYLKAFDGYAESLIDYNQKVTKFGFGFSISR